MKRTRLKRTVSYAPEWSTDGYYYAVRMNGRLIANRLTKKEAAFVKRETLRLLSKQVQRS